MTKVLPLWTTCHEAVTNDKATILELFIYHQEPNEPDGREFRQQLLAELNSIDYDNSWTDPSTSTN